MKKLIFICISIFFFLDNLFPQGNFDVLSNCTCNQSIGNSRCYFYSSTSNYFVQENYVVTKKKKLPKYLYEDGADVVLSDYFNFNFIVTGFYQSSSLLNFTACGISNFQAFQTVAGLSCNILNDGTNGLVFIDVGPGTTLNIGSGLKYTNTPTSVAANHFNAKLKNLTSISIATLESLASPYNVIDGSLRISFYLDNTQNDCNSRSSGGGWNKWDFPWKCNEFRWSDQTDFWTTGTYYKPTFISVGHPNFAANYDYCKSSGNIDLSTIITLPTTVPLGTFSCASGYVSSGRYFSTTSAPAGSYTIVYDDNSQQTYSFTITLYNNPTVNITPTANSTCYNQNMNLNGGAAGGTSPYTHQWSGTTSQLSAIDIVNPVFNASTSGTYAMTYTVTDYHSCQASANKTITVYAQQGGGTVGNAQSICYYTKPAAFNTLTAPSGGNGTWTYQWQSAGDVGGSPGTYSNIPISDATYESYQSTYMNITQWFRRMNTNSCGSVYSNGIKITVSPQLVAGVITGNQNCCYGAIPGTSFGSSTNASGGVISWSKSIDGGSTWSVISGATGQTYAETQALTVTTKYKRTVTSANTSCGSIETTPVTVTVALQLVKGVITGDQGCCYSAVPATTFGSSTNASGGTISWSKSTDGGTTWSVISGATAQTYKETLALTVTTKYKRTVTSANLTCGSVETTPVTVTVASQLVAGVITGSQNCCYGAVPGTSFGSSTNASGGAISWSKSTDGGTTWSVIGGATAQTYVEIQPLTLTTKYKRTVTSANASCGYLETTPVTVTVALQLVKGTITGDQNCCYGAVPGTTFGSSANASGGAISWSKSIDGGTTWSVISGATAQTYKETLALTVTTKYKRTVTSANPLCSYLETTPVTVTVALQLVKGTITGDQNCCYGVVPGTSFGSSTNASGGTISWSKSIDGGTTWAVISGATGQTYAEAQPLTITTNYKRTVTSANPLCSFLETTPVTVTVALQLVKGGITGDQNCCYGVVPGTSIGSSTNASGGTISWSKSTDGGTTWSVISGATGQTYTETLALTITTKYKRTVTSANPLCGYLETNPVTVTVAQQLIKGAITGDQSCCYNAIPGTSFGSSTDASGGAISWSKSIDGGTTWTVISSAYGQTYAETQPLTITTKYKRVVTSAYPSCGYEESTPVTVSVSQQLIQGSISGDQDCCYGAVPHNSFVSVTNASGGVISWYKSNDGGANWNIILGENGQSFTETSHLTLTTKYKRTVTSANPLCGYVETTPVTVTISSEFLPGSISFDLGKATKNVCYNTSNIQISNISDATGGSGSITYSWFYSNDSTIFYQIPGASNNNYTYLGPAINSIYLYRQASSSCGTVNTSIIKIFVYSAVNGGQVSDNQVKCYGSNVDAFASLTPASGGKQNFSYQWQYSSSDITPGDPGWFDISGANLLTYDEGILYNTRYYVRKSTDTCGIGFSTKLKVEIKPVLSGGNVSGNQIICDGQGLTPVSNSVSPTGGMGIYAISWFKSVKIGNAPLPGDPSWNVITGESGLSLSLDSIKNKSYFIRQIGDDCGTVFSNVVTKNSTSQLNAGVIGSDLSGPVCYDSIIGNFNSLSSASGAYGKYSYTWMQSNVLTATPGDVNFFDLSSSNSEIYHFGNILKSALFVRKVSDSVCTSFKYSNVIQVDVKNKILPGQVLGGGTYCNGADLPLFKNKTCASGGFNSFDYSWYKTENMSAVPGDGNWIIIPSSSIDSLDYGVVSKNTLFCRKATDVCGSVYTPKITILVNPKFLAGSVFGSKNICSNTNSGRLYSLQEASGGSSVFNYQWIYTTDSTNYNYSSWNNFTNANDTGINPGILIKTTLFARKVNDGFCSPIYSNSLKISVHNPSDAGTISSNQFVCYGSVPALVTGTQSESTIYQWQKSDNGYDNWKDIKYEKYSDIQLPEVRKALYLRRTALNDECGSRISNTVKISVHDSIIPVSLSVKPRYCIGENINYSLPFSFNTSIYWYYNGITTKSQSFSINSISKNESVYVYNEDSSHCRSFVINYNFIVDSVKAGFYFDLPEVEVGTPIQFKNTSRGAISYKWDFCKDCEPLFDVNPWFYFNQQGVYSIKLYAYSQFGCIDTLFMPNSLNVIDYGYSSIKGNKNDFFFIWPNPVRNILNISGGNISKSTLYIFSSDGRLLKLFNLSSNECSIDFSGFFNGIYILKILRNNNFVNEFKIVKQ